MIYPFKIITTLAIALLTVQIHAQNDTTEQAQDPKPDKIIVRGTVKSMSTNATIINTVVIRKGVGGKFLDQDGNFTIKMNRTDTLIVSATGYSMQKFWFNDSTGTEFEIDVKLSKLEYTLAEHVVMPKRNLSEIHDDLEDVELTLPDRPTGVDAVSSPLTAIYSRFSKMEQSKRLVAEMEYQDKKVTLLKELFRVYVDADIIALSPDEFERFIYFSNVSDEFLRSATEYELITFFQQRYEEYIAFKND